jgi:hypothetical protein
MKILFLNGFTPSELNTYRTIIREATLTSIQRLIHATRMFHIKVSSQIKVLLLRDSPLHFISLHLTLSRVYNWFHLFSMNRKTVNLSLKRMI